MARRVKVKMTSSANNPILCGWLATSMPYIKGLDLLASAKGSIIVVKMIGERGHPFRVPLVIGKGSDSTLAVYTFARGWEHNAEMAEFIIPKKTKFT